MSDIFGSDREYWDEEAAQYEWWREGEEAPDYWYTDEVVLNGLDEYGGYEITGLTLEDWFAELTQDDAYLIQEYNLDHYDIIDQLRQMGEWDDDVDWERYGEAHGS